MNLESSDEEYFDTFSEFIENKVECNILSNQEITPSDLNNYLIQDKDNCNAEKYGITTSDILNNSPVKYEQCTDSINEVIENVNEKTENLCETFATNENLTEVLIPNIDKFDSSDSSDCENLADELNKLNTNDCEQTVDAKEPDVIKSNEEIQLEERMKMESSLSVEEITDLKEKSLSLKEQGNSSFKLEQYDEAIELYSNAILICPLQFSHEHAIFYSNRGAALAKLSKNEEAINDLSAALKLKPDYLKALLRRAELREKCDKLSEALDDYREVLKIDSRNWTALHAEQTLPERIKIQQEKMKEEMLTQLKQLGNLVLKPFGLSTDNFKMVQDPNTGSYSINFQNK